MRNARLLPLAVGLVWLTGNHMGFAAPSADEIWQHVVALQANVQDYTAQVRITPNIPDQDNTVREAKVYVKRPDKVRIDSDSVVFVPREALTIDGIAKHVSASTKLVFMGAATENGRPVYGLKAIPKSDKGGNTRFKFWVWGDNWTIKRTELWVGDQCVLYADWWWIAVQDTYWMPLWVSAAFTPGKLAPGIAGGYVTVQMWDYRVNTGLEDSIFPAQSSPRRRHH